MNVSRATFFVGTRESVQSWLLLSCGADCFVYRAKMRFVFVLL